MPRLREREETYYTTVRGMCRSCRRVTPARVFFKDGKVWQQNLCSECENQPTLIAGDQTWYLEQVTRPRLDRSPLKDSLPSARGCPHDCGPCAWHASPCQLPVISITNACNMQCPICFTHNRPDKLYHMSVEEMRGHVDRIVESAGRVDLINLTGGEPTLHPDLLDILGECRRPEIGRITLNSNGLRLAEDFKLCQQLAERGVVVILSFNTFDPTTSRKMHGRNVVDAKLKAIDNLTRAGARMTLLTVLMRDTNEDAIPGILELMQSNDQILSFTVQTMTYTGQGGGRMEGRAPIPVDEAARIVCERSGGMFQFEDFVSRPAAHPLCYLTAFMLKARDRFVPFARFLDRDRIENMMRDSYLIRVDDQEDSFRHIVNELYSRGAKDELKVFRELVELLYPAKGRIDAFERQRLAETCVRTVYIHAHMDEDTFDCSRAMMCPDLVPLREGGLAPACTYNLFYRMQDGRFYLESTT